MSGQNRTERRARSRSVAFIRDHLAPRVPVVRLTKWARGHTMPSMWTPTVRRRQRKETGTASLHLFPLTSSTAAHSTRELYPIIGIALETPFAAIRHRCQALSICFPVPSHCNASHMTLSEYCIHKRERRPARQGALVRTANPTAALGRIPKDGRAAVRSNRLRDLHRPARATSIAATSLRSARR